MTDAGLIQIKGLTRLRSLALEVTQVTDAGLEHLKGLSQLQSLYLGGTKVTDAGLENLSGLTQLQELDLMQTQVTDAGVKKLQQVLPNCKIGYLSKDAPRVAFRITVLPPRLRSNDFNQESPFFRSPPDGLLTTRYLKGVKRNGAAPLHTLPPASPPSPPAASQRSPLPDPSRAQCPEQIRGSQARGNIPLPTA